MAPQETKYGLQVSVALPYTQAVAKTRDALKTGVRAVRCADGAILTEPPTEMRLEPGDVLIALGARAQLGALQGLTEVPV